MPRGYMSHSRGVASMAAATNAADGRTPIFRSPSAKFRMRNHDRARNADGDAFGSVGEVREQSRSRYDDHTSMVSHRGMRLSTCSFTPLLGEKECGLLCATSPSESSPSLTRARYAGTAGLPGPSQYPARYATPNCHLIDSRASGDNGGFALQPPPKLDGSRFLFCSGGMGG
jgi:hypothetical protein